MRKPPRETQVGERVSEMYIELFLFDNMLMNLLILLLASALLSTRIRTVRLLAFSFAGAVISALAAAGAGVLLSLPAKLALTLAASLALPARGARARLFAFFALLLSALIAGGAVVLVCFALGGSTVFGIVYGGIPLRAALIGAAVTALIPRLVRRVLARRVGAGMTVRLVVELRGGKRLECAALVDTGNTLRDPVTALPVIVLSARRFPDEARSAGRLLPIRTASGRAVLPALRPVRVLIDGASVNALVAFSRAETALVPPSLVFCAESDAKPCSTKGITIHAEAASDDNRKAV